jgi:hypothetical protein
VIVWLIKLNLKRLQLDMMRQKKQLLPSESNQQKPLKKEVHRGMIVMNAKSVA